MRRRKLAIWAVGVFSLFSAAKIISINSQDIKEQHISRQDSAMEVSERTAKRVFFNDSFPQTDKTNIGIEVVDFAKKFMGIPYFYTGKSPSTGFDCSGFTSFVYKHFGYNISPASKEQINAGKRISLSEAKKGDLLIFTGTDKNIRKPGHVGIVISKAGVKPVKFIHSSSNPHKWGVTTNSLADLSYSKRLLEVRRVIE